MLLCGSCGAPVARAVNELGDLDPSMQPCHKAPADSALQWGEVLLSDPRLVWKKPLVLASSFKVRHCVWNYLLYPGVQCSEELVWEGHLHVLAKK